MNIASQLNPNGSKTTVTIDGDGYFCIVKDLQKRHIAKINLIKIVKML